MDSGNDTVAKVLSYFLHKVLMVSGQSGQGICLTIPPPLQERLADSTTLLGGCGGHTVFSYFFPAHTCCG